MSSASQPAAMQALQRVFKKSETIQGNGLQPYLSLLFNTLDIKRKGYLTHKEMESFLQRYLLYCKALIDKQKKNDPETVRKDIENTKYKIENT